MHQYRQARRFQAGNQDWISVYSIGSSIVCGRWSFEIVLALQLTHTGLQTNIRILHLALRVLWKSRKEEWIGKMAKAALCLLDTNLADNMGKSCLARPFYIGRYLLTLLSVKLHGPLAKVVLVHISKQTFWSDEAKATNFVWLSYNQPWSPLASEPPLQQVCMSALFHTQTWERALLMVLPDWLLWQEAWFSILKQRPDFSSTKFFTYNEILSSWHVYVVCITDDAMTTRKEGHPWFSCLLEVIWHPDLNQVSQYLFLAFLVKRR